MIKRILAFVALIISVIAIGLLVLIININQTPDFPHYKQVIINTAGRVSGIKHIPINFTFSFVDEKVNSEMASNGNIIAMNLVNNQGIKVNANSWAIQNELEDDINHKYITRGIMCSFTFNESGTFHPSNLQIVYRDKKTEVYEISDTTISVIDSYQNTFGGDVQTDLIITDNPISVPRLTGLLICVNTFDSDFEIEDIDLGVPGIYPDFSKMVVLYKQMDLNDFFREVKKGTEGYSVFDIARDYNKQMTPFKHLKIKNTDQASKYITFLVPLLYEKRDISKNRTLIFDTTVSMKSENTEKKLFNQIPCVFRPIIEKPEQLLKEN